MVKLGRTISLPPQCIPDSTLWADFYLFFNLYIFEDVGNITLPNAQPMPMHHNPEKLMLQNPPNFKFVRNGKKCLD
jgi:hypothetical protein